MFFFFPASVGYDDILNEKKVKHWCVRASCSTHNLEILQKQQARKQDFGSGGNFFFAQREPGKI